MCALEVAKLNLIWNAVKIYVAKATRLYLRYCRKIVEYSCT